MLSRLARAALITALGASLACAGHVEEEVAFDVYRSPTAGFEKVGFLGIARPKGEAGKYQGDLVSQVRRCGQYQKTNALAKVFKLPTGDKDAVVKKLKSDIEAYQDSRYVHAVLLVDSVKREVERKTVATRFVHLKDRLDHRWTDSYGTAGTPAHPLYGVEEISPVTVATAKKIGQKQTRITLGVRYVLYNKLQDTVVFDRQSSVTGSVQTYTGKPAVSDKQLEAQLWRQLLGRVGRAVCPKIATVTRKLYAEDSGSKADNLVASGIELVEDDEKWEEAANQWRKAVLIDKKHGYAYHNLGVYYERAGNLPAAMEEYEKAKRSRLRGPNPKQYDTTLKILRPSYDPPAVEPRIYTVSGANWVTIFGGPRNALKVGGEYAVFRSRRHPDERQDAKAGDFDGTTLTEVGRVHVVKVEPPFVLARVKQYLEDWSVEVGDLVLRP
jgi:tetratricopeptide (TPR) repeat protein